MDEMNVIYDENSLESVIVLDECPPADHSVEVDDTNITLDTDKMIGEIRLDLITEDGEQHEDVIHRSINETIHRQLTASETVRVLHPDDVHYMAV